MIDSARLREIAVDEKMPIGTVEKELALACALHALSNDRLRDRLSFKGGTAIKMIYHPSSRFSEDLDFTVTDMEKEEAIRRLHEVIEGVQIDSVTFHGAMEDRFSLEGERLRIPFTGPMRFRNSIRVDLSFRDDLILEAKPRPAMHPYGGELAATIKTLEFEEIIAEKIRALMSRGYARDYYDIWSHIDKIADKGILRRLTEEKCTLSGYPYAPTNIFGETQLGYARAEWRNQLRHLIRDYTEFEEMLPKLRIQLAFLDNPS